MQADSSSWEAAADPRRRVGHAVEFHPVIGSTNDRARELLREPVPRDGVAVVADLQTDGRGRHGRTWLSPPGANLMVSVGIRPILPARDAWRLGAAAALASVAACERWARLAVKWPNDVVTVEGRKVGGILVETSVEGERLVDAVIGAGLNVNWPTEAMPPELAQVACSLADLAGCPVDRVALLSRYLDALDDELGELAAGRSPVGRLRARSWLDGRSVRIESATGAVIGRAVGIGEDGELIVARDGETVAVAFGEVVQVRPVQGVLA